MTRSSYRTGLLALAALCAAACVDVGSPITREPTTAIGRPDPATALVGGWSRTVIFTAGDGDVHSSETIWHFRSDSTADRTVVATSVAAGVADTVVATALWEASGSQVTITYLPPDAGTATFEYSVHADTLTLGGQDFVRDE